MGWDSMGWDGMGWKMIMISVRVCVRVNVMEDNMINKVS
jgi:hypothetical protein